MKCRDQQICAQTPVYPDAGEIARTTGDALRSLDARLTDEGRQVKASSREECLSLICSYSYRFTIVLTESAWAEIDAEQNLGILNALLLLTMVQDFSPDFCSVRVYLLEHKHLWPHLVPA